MAICYYLAGTHSLSDYKKYFSKEKTEETDVQTQLISYQNINLQIFCTIPHIQS